MITVLPQLSAGRREARRNRLVNGRSHRHLKVLVGCRCWGPREIDKWHGCEKAFLPEELSANAANQCITAHAEERLHMPVTLADRGGRRFST